jgi:hypothetical protein
LVADHSPISGEILNIAMVMNANSSGVGGIWLSLIPEGPFNFDPRAYMLPFTNPTQFNVGSNKFGIIEITERRKIAPSFIDMMGFTPVCDILHALFLI